MRRPTPDSLTIGLLLFLAVGLWGCDQTPSSVEEFDVQGTMDSSPSALALSPELTPEFGVSFQGLEGFPTAEIESDAFEISQVSEEGSPRNGERRWRLSLTGEIEELLAQESLLIRGTDTEGQEIVDTLSVFATSTLSINPDFSSSFITFADYEGDVTMSEFEAGEGEEVDTPPFPGDQRSISTSGGTSVQLQNPDPDGFATPEAVNQPEGSNGVRFLRVEGNANGSMTINRDTNLPDADSFSFLIRQASDFFTLTITFTEEVNGESVEHELDLPVPAGSQWLKIQIPFDAIGDDFDPVAARSGGSGPLTSIEMSADQNITYAVDEMLFEVEGVGPRVEFHDFEKTNNAFGPPFCQGNEYGWASASDGEEMVADGSDGFFARSINGDDCFGYNYGDGFAGVALLYLDVDGDDVVSFYAKGQSGGELQNDQVGVFLESFEGGFGGGDAVTVDLPSDGSWERFEIPLSQLGDDPSALQDGQLFNIGFNAGGDFLIDDIKIMPK